MSSVQASNLTVLRSLLRDLTPATGGGSAERVTRALLDSLDSGFNEPGAGGDTSRASPNSSEQFPGQGSGFGRETLSSTLMGQLIAQQSGIAAATAPVAASAAYLAPGNRADTASSAPQTQGDILTPYLPSSLAPGDLLDVTV